MNITIHDNDIIDGDRYFLVRFDKHNLPERYEYNVHRRCSKYLFVPRALLDTFSLDIGIRYYLGHEPVCKVTIIDDEEVSIISFSKTKFSCLESDQVNSSIGTAYLHSFPITVYWASTKSLRFDKSNE